MCKIAVTMAVSSVAEIQKQGAPVGHRLAFPKEVILGKQLTSQSDIPARLTVTVA